MVSFQPRMSAQLFLLTCGWTGGGEGLGAGWWKHLPAPSPWWADSWAFQRGPAGGSPMGESMRAALCARRPQLGIQGNWSDHPLLHPHALHAHGGVTRSCRGWCCVGALHPPPTHVPDHRHRKPFRSTRPKTLHRLILYLLTSYRLPQQAVFPSHFCCLTCPQLSISTCAFLKVSRLSPFASPR